jgi:3'(2'), 5'-bisphosphate nucleotidase
MSKRNNLDIAILAALEAGRAIMEIYENEDFSVEFKSDNSPLTKADLASHDIICNKLKQNGIPILSEEGKDRPYTERKNWDQLWIVDPIDGTKEFIKRNGEFTVNIALVENQIPILGVIYVPALQTLYFAGRSIGSFKLDSVDFTNSLEYIYLNAVSLPIRSGREKYTIVASRSHLSPETVNFIEEIQLEKGDVDTISKGSSLKLCMVAEGTANCYPRFAPTMEWDTAAGHAICKYAGFKVDDWILKKEMLYNKENLLNNWFLVH